MVNKIILKPGEAKRILSSHPWVYSNEINTTLSPIKTLQPGEEVFVYAHDQRFLGKGYINPQSLIAVRLLTREMDENIDTEFFYRKIQAAKEWRDELFDEPYYRLIYSEADELPGLIIDRYGDHLAVQINTAGMEVRLELITAALKRVFPQLQSILLRNESYVREYEGLTPYSTAGYGEPPERLQITENGVHFTVPFVQGQKTGWFYDQRFNHARLRDYVKGKTVLDVFSYLGGFGVQAAVFGAKEVTCIESSAIACEAIAENADLNHVGNIVKVVQADAFKALASLRQDNQLFDVIIVDPPALIKKFKDRKAGMLAYQRLNEQALKLLNAGGILISCSCSMHIDMDEFQTILFKSAVLSKCSVQLLERGHQAPDHPILLAVPETEYLKVVILRKIR